MERRHEVTRRLLSLLTALSLVLCVAVVVLWVRSHSIGDELRCYRPPRLFEVLSSGGLVRIGSGQFVSGAYPPPTGWQGTFWPFRRENDTYEFDLSYGTTFGFGYERWVRQSPGLTADVRLTTFPFWAPALTFAALPGAAIVRLISRRRRRRRSAARGFPVDATTPTA